MFPGQLASGNAPDDPRSLVHKLALADGPFNGWLWERLCNRYDYACVDHPDEFAGVRRAVTVNGQMKHSEYRHEKDDRSRLNDRANWVLGFTTEAKEAELEARLRQAEDELRAAEAELQADDDQNEALRQRQRVLDELQRCSWAAIDVAAAQQKGVKLSQPDAARETAGEGVDGKLGRHHVIVGGQDFVRRKLKLKQMARPDAEAGSVLVAVAVDGRLAAHLVLSDAVRDDAGRALARLRTAGINRIVLASGDAAAVVDKIGETLGLDVLRSELTPQQKVEIVIAERQNGIVLMAGDGVNDAPALAAADLGIAMGARGSAASAEAADAVLLVDNLERIAEAVEISRRSRGIALQSVYVGLGLSIAAMIAAALGYLGVVEGALLQEAIDLAVILNALRALR